MLGFLDIGGTDERQAIYRRTDHSNIAGSGDGSVGSGCLPQAQLLGAVILSMEEQVRRHGGVGSKTTAIVCYPIEHTRRDDQQ